jgi:hypothetical protein
MSLSTLSGAKVSNPAIASNDEKIDQHEIDRKQPGGAATPGFEWFFGDVKLARQQYDRHGRGSVMVRNVSPARAEHRRVWACIAHEQRHRPIEHHPM